MEERRTVTVEEWPSLDELELVAQRLLVESEEGSDDLIIAVGAIYECLALREGIEHAIATCADPATVAYLKDVRERAKH